MLRQIFHRCRNIDRNLLQRLHIGNMYDQRIIRRPALGGIGLLCRLLIQSIGPQSIHSLRRKRHKAALLQNRTCLLYGSYVYFFRINLFYNRLHRYHPN